jgi:hypothetical protein
MPLHIKFEILGSITNRRTIAVGNRIRELERLVTTYGRGRWRKMSGEALIELPNGDIYYAELHWYEAHGIGQKEMGFKKLLEKRD